MYLRTVHFLHFVPSQDPIVICITSHSQHRFCKTVFSLAHFVTQFFVHERHQFIAVNCPVAIGVQVGKLFFA